jgi:phenylacetate-CoA ligase
MLPAAVRHILYPLHERALHRPTFAYLAELERSQWLDRAGVEALQARKLGELLRSASRHSAWHAARIRAAGLDLADGESVPLERLRRLPTMNKADAAANRESIAWKGVPGGLSLYNTGGSSGEPLVFYFGRMRQASDAAGRMRARRWWGVEVGAPEVYLWGAPVELAKSDRVRRIRDLAFNQLVLNAFAMGPSQMDEYLAAIGRFQPECIYGYASSVALLAAHALATGRQPRLHRLKVVCTTGEPLYPHQRKLIREAFGATVANEFGSRDIGFTAHEAPGGQMLLMSESIVLEVLDEAGDPVSPGRSGEAVMTALCSQAQPFIRYRTGDVVRLAEGTDPAGRGLHVIADVVGRSTDFLVRGDGTILHALAGIYVLRAVEGVGEFRIIQHTADRIEVQVVPSPRWTDAMTGQIVAGLRKRMGDEVAVDVKLCPEIAPERSGKHRYVVSRVPLPGDLAVSTATRD